ncbi:hypothetical protein GCK72_019928 [Caenorhabditis remanei]|uniref:Uncharacterized protein n=1 Tax=Caenorhabditis remanei TaxID=31234 RepID=A0A6A5GFM0_CAERE|nr:hypothetical protein GCK72_019928 [Caenorhabditis remanei]KAF1753371.1 hypothetical protein GCK72_019928 [Caenorhabditis remanei]
MSENSTCEMYQDIDDPIMCSIGVGIFQFSECGFIDNYTVAIYGAELSEFIQEYPSILGICQSADGLSQVIPAVTLPVLTFLLIKQLDITEKNRSNFLKSQKNNENSKTDTTKMIMMMTIASTLAEGPIGVLPIVEIFACPFLMVISANLMVIFGAVVALNTSTHCFVCCAISSQYRKTVTQVFLWENHSRTQITTQSKTAGSQSWSTQVCTAATSSDVCLLIIL